MDATLLSADFWNSNDNHLLLNPKLSRWDADLFQRLYMNKPSHLTAHVFLASSGTTTAHKLIALSKRSLLGVGQIVNNHFQITAQDTWLRTLPFFHVSGLSIFARSYLSGSKVYSLSEGWNVKDFCQTLKNHPVTHTSLVPTQVYDLVHGKIKAPESGLRCVLVGGASLDPHLHEQATKLGWPILPCYGMTESAAFFAFLKNSAYYPLPHIEWKTNTHNELLIKSELLFSGHLVIEEGEVQFRQPFDIEGFWNTSDVVSPNSSSSFQLLGRNQEFIKILGEKVSLKLLEKRIKDFLPPSSNVLLFVSTNARRGHDIIAVAEQREKHDLHSKLQQFNLSALAYERIDGFYVVSKIPQTEMGKVRQIDLEKIQKSTPYQKL